MSTVKGNSQKHLRDLKKIYFGLNTFSILSIYKKLDPFNKLRYNSACSRKITVCESLNIIVVRSVIMIYSLIVNTFLTILFGVVPVSVFMHSACDSREKNYIVETTLILVSAALLIIIHLLSLAKLNLISVILILTWIVLMHIVAFFIVRKKYKKISFKLCEKE